MKTLLIVDDDRLIRWSLNESLKRRYLVHTAASGREALRLIERMPVDAVLTDLDLPRMNGAQLVETLRRTHPGTKVLVLSGSASPAVQERLKKLGVLEFIDKPFDLEVVSATLERHLESDDAAAGDRAKTG